MELIFRELAGDIAYALGRLADVLDAELIIVGSRRHGIVRHQGVLHWLGGSSTSPPTAPPGCCHTGSAGSAPLPWESKTV